MRIARPTGRTRRSGHAIAADWLVQRVKTG
jgi:hypothetical protein